MTTKKTYYIFTVLLALVALWGYYHSFIGYREEEEVLSMQGPICAWKITHKGKTSYICGSIHFGKASLYPLPAVLEDAFATSEKLVVEVDIYDMVRGSNTTGVSKVLSQLLVYLYLQLTTPVESRLYGQLGEEGHAALQAQMRGYGFSYLERAMINCAKPKQRQQLLGACMRAHKIGTALYGIEMHFLQKARVTKKPIEALETAGYQLQQFRQLKAEQPLATTAEYLAYMDYQARVMQMTLQGWLKGDLATLCACMALINASIPNFQAVLIEARNPSMLAHIIGLLEDEEALFIVVGCLHLAGEKGLIAGLRDQGYSLEQLEVKE